MTDLKTRRLAIDIGGRFTDTVVMNADDFIAASAKPLTTRDNPADSAIAGAQRILAGCGGTFDQVVGFIHGTRLATNALIACSKSGAGRLCEMMDAFGLDDLQGLAEHIIGTSYRGTLAAITGVTPGVYRNV